MNSAAVHIVVDSNRMCAAAVVVAVVVLAAAKVKADPDDSFRIVSVSPHTLQSAECLFSFRENH